MAAPHGFDAEAFNTAPRADLLADLRTCLDVPRWAEVIADGRPYGSADEIRETADRAALDLTEDEVHAALAAHPRIGERPVGDGESASLSRSEQSGVDDQDRAALRAANAEYEQRFGHVYLVCASGRSGAELLEILRSRLHNDPATELGVVADELRKIALLRLEKVIR